MIVPIGADCGVADFCKKYGLRTCSLPFDWAVTYNGVSDCVIANFTDFILIDSARINKYDVYFHHHFFEATVNADATAFLRRVERLKEIFASSEEKIIFCRKGHAVHHHREHNGRYSVIKSDIDDAEALDAVLSSRYPALKYEIVLFLVCGQCFDSALIYTSASENIKIYNISAPQENKALFEKMAKEILLSDTGNIRETV
jgi:hypothetical protein